MLWAFTSISEGIDCVVGIHFSKGGHRLCCGNSVLWEGIDHVMGLHFHKRGCKLCGRSSFP